MGRSVGLPLPADPRDETTIAAVDGNDIRGDVDRCLRNRARSAVQDRVRLLRAALLVHLFAGEELLEQPHLSLRHRGHPVLGNGGAQIFVSRLCIPVLPGNFGHR